MRNSADASRRSWMEALVGAVTGALAAWFVVIIAHVSRNGAALLINSDVMGAAIGAGLAVAGARYIDNLKQKSITKRVKILVREAAINLEIHVTEYAQWSNAYINQSFDAPGYINSPDAYRSGIDWQSREMFSQLERAAAVFDMAASAVFATDESEMIKISELSRLSNEAGRGLNTIEGHVKDAENSHALISNDHDKGKYARRALILKLRAYTGHETGIAYVW